MPFEARLYIQGVGVYVPHEANNEVLVLFPSHEQAHRRGIRDLDGQPICRHHAVVQFNPRYLDDRSRGPLTDRRLPKSWTTLDVNGMWVGFHAEPAAPLDPTRRLVNGSVPGVPHLPGLLQRFNNSMDAALDPRAFPGGGSDAEFLAAGLFLDAGVLSPYLEFEGLFRFEDRNGERPQTLRSRQREFRSKRDRDNPEDSKFASVLKVELGQVETFKLRFRPFGSAEIVELPLHSPWSELEVWVRHFCDLSWPDPDQDLPVAGEADIDFALNYALLQNLENLLHTSNHRLPVPTVSPSWAHGGPIGLEPRKCMGAGSTPQSFQNPFS